MKTTNERKKNGLVEGVVITCLSIALGLTACQKEGTAEKAGQKIDLASGKVEQTIDTAKESLDKNVDKAHEGVIKSTDATKGAIETAGLKIDMEAEKLEQKVGSVKESVVERAKTTGENVDDSIISANVKAAILGDTLLKASHIDVTTAKGIVTLKGTVDSEPVLGRAMEIASSQKNVKSVKTDLVVNVFAPSK
jgi:hyperosmotically inducible protein